MATYTPRQEEILGKLGKSMGFTTDQITSVAYEADIPVNVTYSNAAGTFTRSTYDQLGGILTDLERSGIQSIRAEQRALLSSNFLSNQALLALNPQPQANDFIRSLGRTPIVDPAIAASRLAFDPKTARLIAAGLGKFADNPLFNPISRNQVQFQGDQTEDRVRISDPSGVFISSANPILRPLVQSDNQVIFPYTPSITVNHTANYDESQLTHSNYSYQFYQNSPTATISITGTFTAKDKASADYVVAVQHFFRSVTKMFYGQDSEAGVPPPVLRLDGHGDYQFSSVPVVVTSFSASLPTDVDYITSSSNTKVPVMQDFSLELKPVYSRRSISNDFSLREFAAGRLLGAKNGRGGFI